MLIFYAIKADDCGCSVSVISASATYDAGTNYGGFVSTTTDPLGLFSGQSVFFRGLHQGGSETVYDYQINCNEPCWISNVNIQGAAWYSSQLIFYNGDASIVLASASVGGGNSFQSHNIVISAENYQTQYRLVEKNHDSVWRYRSSITLTQGILYIYISISGQICTILFYTTFMIPTVYLKYTFNSQNIIK